MCCVWCSHRVLRHSLVLKVRECLKLRASATHGQLPSPASSSSGSATPLPSPLPPPLSPSPPSPLPPPPSPLPPPPSPLPSPPSPLPPPLSPLPSPPSPLPGIHSSVLALCRFDMNQLIITLDAENRYQVSSLCYLLKACLVLLPYFVRKCFSK